MKKKPIVFMFSGQGSQYFNMAKELFDSVEIFRKHMIKLNDIVIKISGNSVLDYLYDEEKNKGDRCDDIQYTHPAIFMIEYSLAQAMMENEIYPDYLLGSSLGEFTSIAVAKVLSVEETLECILEQVKCLKDYCESGGMVALFYSPELYEKVPFIYENCEMVGINYNKHFVVSGRKRNLKSIEEFLKKRDILFQELPVEHGFHSKLIESASEEYLKILKKKNNNTPSIPIISCMYGKVISEISYDYLWNVVREPIKFSETINSLEKIGNYRYIDLGPGGSLANFTKRNLSINSKSEVMSVLSMFNNDLNKFSEVKNKIFKKNCKDRKGEKEMKAYIFPGQGGQHKGMGVDLFDEFSELTNKSNEILGYSIKELCLEDPDNKLGQTQYTQPAMYVVNALSYLKKIKDIEMKPDYIAGHSLGEYSALFAAGAYDFETGLKLVKKRGELMSGVSGGGMAAIIGLKEDKIKEIIKKSNLDSIDIANLNTPSQIVISGPKEDIKRAKLFFEDNGAKNYIILNVSGAFHSRYMENISKEFEKYLEKVEFSKLNIPVISNIYARPYKNDQIKRTLIDQISNSVKWTETIRYLMGKGEIEIEQVGPGAILMNMCNVIKRETTPLFTIEEDVNEKSDKKTDYKENKQKSNELEVMAENLGCPQFKKDYGIKYAYVTGSMYRGISSKELVVKMAKAGFMSFFGTGGLSVEEIKENIRYIQNELTNNEAYGMNFLSNFNKPQEEEKIIDIFLKYGIKNIEASAFVNVTPALARFRLKGLKRDEHGMVISSNRIIGKISRPEVAELFLSPINERLVQKLLSENKITEEEAELSKEIPLVDDLCLEADSGSYTDCGVPYVLMPAIVKLRDEMMVKFNYEKKVRIGIAGGIGTAEAGAAAFIMGSDFIMTGSINQCTVESSTSDVVKDLLQQINIQDTEYAPAGDMFEIGAKIQVLRKGVFFPARANKLYELYRQYNSIDEIDERTKSQLQKRYFKRSFEQVYQEVKSLYPANEIEKAEKNPKHKMALIFKWYFAYSSRVALEGDEENKVDYQVHCGPALGAFNQWVKGSELEDWKNRNVDKIAEKIMSETAKLLSNRIKTIADFKIEQRVIEK